MLKSDNGTVEISGRKITLMAEFASLVHTLVEKEMFTKDDIDECTKMAYISEEEIKKEIKDNSSQITDMLIDLLLS